MIVALVLHFALQLSFYTTGSFLAVICFAIDSRGHIFFDHNLIFLKMILMLVSADAKPAGGLASTAVGTGGGEEGGGEKVRSSLFLSEQAIVFVDCFKYALCYVMQCYIIMRQCNMYCRWLAYFQFEIFIPKTES